MARDYACSHVLTTPILGSWPQTDYNVYVYHGNGTADEPGYEKTFREAGKAYRGMPSWDTTEEEWTGRPPVGTPTMGQELPAYVGQLVADVLDGKAAKYDLTIIKQAA